MLLLAFIPSVNAQSADPTGAELQVFCPTKAELNAKRDSVVPEWYPNAGYYNWSDVPHDRWYWQSDWDEFLANETDPFPGNRENYYGDRQELYPVGFRRFVLPWYNEPPLCMRVPGSGDKKIEVLLESDLENANFCIHDASDVGVNTNDVGDVNTCGSGQVYACFTAATTNAIRGTNRDFGFYISCQDGCEQMDMSVWVRVRLSEMSWQDGKSGVSDDLEMWCEEEKGTMEVIELANGTKLNTTNMMYQYPSDLIPDEPSQYPWHIYHIFGYWNAGGLQKVTSFNFLLPILSVFSLAFLFA